MTVTIRLWSDWSLDPFYVDEGNGSFELTSADEVAETFAVPDDVSASSRPGTRSTRIT